MRARCSAGRRSSTRSGATNTRSRHASSTSTFATSGGRSRASPRVRITSWPCRESATASPTPARPDSKLAERLTHKTAPTDAWVRHHEVALADALLAKQQDVDVDDARSPATGRPASSLALNLLGRLEQLTGGPRPCHLDHLVQESRLILYAPRLGFNDAALTHDQRTFLTQAPARSAQVA